MSDTKSTANSAIELTKEGLEELKAEYEELVKVKMPKIIERVSSAREQGDLSENADYQSARDEQAILQARINEIEEILARAKVVVSKKTAGVSLGSVVVVTVGGNKKKKFTFHIVGEFESDPEEGKISNVSPVGKALVGHKKGDEVVVKTPGGELKYTIEDFKSSK